MTTAADLDRTSAAPARRASTVLLRDLPAVAVLLGRADVNVAAPVALWISALKD